MSRYIQKLVEPKPKKKRTTKSEIERKLPKPTEYSSVDLEKAAKIYSSIGGKY
tara:strand:- start:314 stop:472 length:159 start_codon:yes stop_codon:yes gene_type:complete